MAHVLASRNEEAIEWVDRALVQKPDFLKAMIVRTVACGRLGRREEGREWVGVDQVLEISPEMTVKNFSEFLWSFKVPEAVALQADRLRKAVGPPSRLGMIESVEPLRPGFLGAGVA